ncbi:hypothetical protein [uncultured Kordia sp.]|uniref:hypothetical protein n=1 Tax=uncultured Kordia sp. TaxID=507699 RepID=UPI00261F11CD|nr:hypothetical protein [uncultured Kordia sp.]
MQLRGAVSDKQYLITILKDNYTKASSEKDFYTRLQEQNIELYSRNNKIVGAKLERKFRFKTLGYDRVSLQELNKNLSQNKRLDMLKRIRLHQEQQQQSKERQGRERTRKRGR